MSAMSATVSAKLWCQAGTHVRDLWATVCVCGQRQYPYPYYVLSLDGRIRAETLGTRSAMIVAMLLPLAQ